MERVILTPDNYPTMFTLCTAIALDNDAAYGKKEFAMPLGVSAELMQKAEKAVEALTAEEMEVFATGEQAEITAIAQRGTRLTIANCILNAFFNDL